MTAGQLKKKGRSKVLVFTFNLVFVTVLAVTLGLGLLPDTTNLEMCPQFINRQM